MPARLLIACLLALWVGCGKQSAPAPAESTADNAARPTNLPAAAARTDPAAAAADEAQMAAVLGELTQVVRKYSVERRRVPTSLEELVADGYLTRVPPAPTGKRFVISKDLRVQLVKR